MSRTHTFEGRGIAVNMDMNGFHNVKGSLDIGRYVMNIDGPDGTLEQQLISTFGNEFVAKEYSTLDRGAFSVSCLWNPGDIAFRYLWNLWKTGGRTRFQIVRPLVELVPEATAAATRGVTVTAGSSTANGVATFAGSENIQLTSDALAAPGTVLVLSSANLQLVRLGDASGQNEDTSAVVAPFQTGEDSVTSTTAAVSTATTYQLISPAWTRTFRATPTNLPPTIPTVGRSEVSFNLDIHGDVEDSYSVTA